MDLMLQPALALKRQWVAAQVRGVGGCPSPSDSASGCTARRINYRSSIIIDAALFHFDLANITISSCFHSSWLASSSAQREMAAAAHGGAATSPGERAPKCFLCMQHGCTFQRTWLGDPARRAWLCSDFAGAREDTVSLPSGARDFWVSLLLHASQRTATGSQMGFAFFIPNHCVSVAALAGIHVLPDGLARILRLLPNSGHAHLWDSPPSESTAGALADLASSAAAVVWSVLDQAVHWLATQALPDSSQATADGAASGGPSGSALDGAPLAKASPAEMNAVWQINSVAEPALEQLRAAAASAWAQGLPLLLASRPQQGGAGGGSTDESLHELVFVTDAAQATARELSLCCTSRWAPPQLKKGVGSTPALSGSANQTSAEAQLTAWLTGAAYSLLQGSARPSAELLALAISLQQSGQGSLRLHSLAGPVLLPAEEAIAEQNERGTVHGPMLQHLTAACTSLRLRRRLAGAEAEAAALGGEAKVELAAGRREGARHVLRRHAGARRRCASLHAALAKLQGVLDAIAQARVNRELLGGMAGASAALAWHSEASNRLLEGGVLEDLDAALAEAVAVQDAVAAAAVGSPPADEADTAAAMAELEAELQAEAVRDGGLHSPGGLSPPRHAPGQWELPSPPGSAGGCALPMEQQPSGTSTTRVPVGM